MAVVEKLHHVLEAQQFSRDFLEHRLFPLTDEMRDSFSGPRRNSLRDKMVGIVFYEPSTRTRNSFDLAVKFLGGQTVVTENAKENSSAAKSESIEDTVAVYNRYHLDALVLRHGEAGIMARAASRSIIPIINGGEGSGSHPTQGFLDGYTAKRFIGTMDGLRVGIIGDVNHSRVARSFTEVLSVFNNNSVHFVYPEGFGPQQELQKYLVDHNVSFTEGNSLAEAANQLDIFYMLRPQFERMTEEEKARYDPMDCILDRRVREEARDDSIFMHIGPRNEEIPTTADNDPRLVMLDMAEYGLYTRMALLEMILAD